MVRFREVQPFWHNPVAIVSTVVVWAAVGLVNGRGVAVWPGALVAGLASALLSVRLVTIVSVDESRVRFPPFEGRRLRPGDLTAVDACTYGPIREFGGWEYRIGRRGARAYNVSGNRGVRVTLTDGGELVIGSRRPEGFAAALQPLVVPPT